MPLMHATCISRLRDYRSWMVLSERMLLACWSSKSFSHEKLVMAVLVLSSDDFGIEPTTSALQLTFCDFIAGHHGPLRYAVVHLFFFSLECLVWTTCLCCCLAAILAGFRVSLFKCTSLWDRDCNLGVAEYIAMFLEFGSCPPTNMRLCHGAAAVFFLKMRVSNNLFIHLLIGSIRPGNHSEVSYKTKRENSTPDSTTRTT